MERKVKQVILSIIFEYIAKILVFTVIIILLINLLYEFEPFITISYKYLQSKDNVIFGILCLSFTFGSYLIYKVIDREILENIQILVNGIEDDNYEIKVNIFELLKIQNAFTQKKKELQDKNQFIKTAVSYISHDMKTPVTIIDANINLIRKNKDILTDKGMERLARIENESHKIEEYISGLMELTIGLIKEEMVEKISLAAFRKKINTEVSLYADQMEHEIKIHDYIEEKNNESLFINQKQLGKCVVHLLNNAFEHKKEAVKMEMFMDRQYLFVKVIDDGNGFDEDSLRKAKEMFYTNNQGRTYGKGYGVGLYFVDSYMQSIQGELLLQNAMNKGAEQIMKIPYFRGEKNG